MSFNREILNELKELTETVRVQHLESTVLGSSLLTDAINKFNKEEERRHREKLAADRKNAAEIHHAIMAVKAVG